jgi:hypothetical protein
MVMGKVKGKVKTVAYEESTRQSFEFKQSEYETCDKKNKEDE